MKLKSVLNEIQLYKPVPESFKIDHREYVTSFKYTEDKTSIKDGVPMYGFFSIDGKNNIMGLDNEHIKRFSDEMKKVRDEFSSKYNTGKFKGIDAKIGGASFGVTYHILDSHGIVVKYIPTFLWNKQLKDRIVDLFIKTSKKS